MKTFEPGRLVDEVILAEDQPFDFKPVARFRGVELVRSAQRVPSQGPYRAGEIGSTRRVVVCQPNDYVRGEMHFDRTFNTIAKEYAKIDGSAAPRMLHVLGRKDQIEALVMESIEGTSLQTVLAELGERGERLPHRVALAIIHQLTSLWEMAAEMSVFIDLGDILVDPSGRVRARPTVPSEHARQNVGAAASIFMGGIHYLSPEEYRGESSTQSGMFTLGLLLYEILAGRHPMRREEQSTFQFIRSMAMEPLPQIQEQCPQLPLPIARFVECATSRSPEERFETWSEFRQCLAALRSARPPTSARDIVDALPEALRPVPKPEVDLANLGDWQSLPRSGWRRLPLPRASTRKPAPARPAVHVDPTLSYPGPDRRPMIAHEDMLIDARPVTAAEYARYAFEVGVERGDLSEQPRTMVSIEQAQAYARWAGKRLPSEDEWSRLVEAIGAERLDVGVVWEWTATPKDDGHVVRGGRWRDAWERPPSPNNRSWEHGPAPDIGFRCVRALDRPPD